MKYKYNLNLPLMRITILLFLINVYSNVNALNLTFCTKFSGNNDTIKEFENATWQIWMPNYGNISVGNAFYLVPNNDNCKTALTIINVNDSSKNLLMTDTNILLLQQNQSWPNSPIQIQIPRFDALFLKYCNKFLLNMTLGSSTSITFTPIECTFPTALENKYIGKWGSNK